MHSARGIFLFFINGAVLFKEREHRASHFSRKCIYQSRQEKFAEFLSIKNRRAREECARRIARDDRGISKFVSVNHSRRSESLTLSFSSTLLFLQTAQYLIFARNNATIEISKGLLYNKSM